MTLVRWDPRALRRWSPSRHESQWSDHWDTLFDDFFSHSPATCCDWSPALDVHEEDKNYFVRVDLPGMAKEDVKLTYENDVLTITGERKGETEKKEGKMHRSERFAGKFTRSLRFPSDVDPAKIDATFKNGVLEVTLEKSEEAMVRSIEVK